MTTTTHQAEGSKEELTIEEYARLAVDIASDRLGSDIALLDIGAVSDFADYFIIVSGETGRHLDAISNDVQRGLREKGLRVLHREGTAPGGWILLDYGAVVVHVFDRATRERYDLERLWSRAKEIVRVQ
ncbi:MAG: ribosome silencing factor [Chloroflexi bacterium]|nr:ribosome silencing factor [Chloroflexota bacterium]MCH8102512.1 ribosome silencing factor [Chloroflexota bacterium]